MFALRQEYKDYVNDCMDADTNPWKFRDWFEVTYHYEIEDNK